MRRPLIPVVLALAGSLLAACSDGAATGKATPTPSATAAPTATPTVAPTTPAPAATTPAATAAPAVPLRWKGCGGGFECATLTVQLDASKPALGTVGISVTRRRATGARIGSLIVNPGGPGASAVDYVKDAYSRFPSAIRQRFDIAAFDPRGVGRTAPVRCLSTAELDAYFHLDPVPDDQAERDAYAAGNKKLTDGCRARSSRVLPYVDTRTVAQDLDRVRAALGDPKLTYLGYSYGTSIGAAYLDQFPTRVRAMVLDGALDPRLSWDQLLAGQSKGFDVALGAFLADCERTRCAFREAVTGDLFSAFDALADKVETRQLETGQARKVGPGEFTLGVGLGLYSKGYWGQLGEALAEAVDGQGATLLAFNDAYLDRSGSGYKNVNEANFAVNCVDRPWPRTLQPYYDLAAKVGKDYPRFGPAIALSGIGCSTWPVPPIGKPHAVTGAGSPPVVVIGTTRDPATPYSWAVALADQLDKGVLITHEGDGHTVYRNGAPNCVLRPVNAYLISLTAPAKATC